eukprot:CAMPEP_0117684812 /NCGR_PEP_ID=MMETSP0804-20121206/21343_1 /TAXON_ID=1074897 /ORGANISM="Tetraselmis astigmatica, Strain CCMP880" /LENGTH=61 /DNA_ID=CAMNT_0005495917 /DNA_START=89 /DNA_END=274 /DNA_ORIENTATION=+
MGIETVPPMVTIALAIAAMGGLQGLVHWGAYGKPKAVCQGTWDIKMAARDREIQAAAKAQK